MKIGTLAFPADQQRKLERILNLSRARTYELTDTPQPGQVDLLVVFGEASLPLAGSFNLPDSHVVLADRSAPSASHPHLKVPFISSRVLRVLDAIAPLEPEPQPVSKPPAASQAQEAPAQPASLGHESTPVQDRTPETPAPTPEPVIPSAPVHERKPEPGPATKADDNPFSKYESRIAEVQAQQAQQAADASAMEYSVLVVDDSAPMQQVLAKELSKLEQKINVDFADDGETALEKVAANHYDFIFLDIMMPGIDGFETCTQMRAMPALKKTPIIMLSSKTSPLDEVKGIMAGSSTYLTKPINPEEFQKVIKRVSRWVSEFQANRNQAQ